MGEHRALDDECTALAPNLPEGQILSRPAGIKQVTHLSKRICLAIVGVNQIGGVQSPQRVRHTPSLHVHVF